MIRKLLQFLTGLFSPTAANSKQAWQLLFFVPALALFLAFTFSGTFTTSTVAVPGEYSSLKPMSSVEVEQRVAEGSTEASELVFIKGTKSVVVVGKKFEEGRLVSLADTDELAKSAAAHNVATSTIDGVTITETVFFWYVIAGGLGLWLFFIMFTRPNENHASLAGASFIGLKGRHDRLLANKGWNPFKFHLYLWLLLVATVVTLMYTKAFHNPPVAQLPAEYATVPTSQAWQVEHYLKQSPHEFQRVVVIDGVNAVFVVVQPSSGNAGEVESKTSIARVVSFGSDKARMDKFVAAVTAAKVPTKNVTADTNDNWFATLPSWWSRLLIFFGIGLGLYGMTLLVRWDASKRQRYDNSIGRRAVPVQNNPATTTPKPNKPSPRDSCEGELLIEGDDRKTLDDVAGCDEAVERFRLVAQWVRDATVYRHFRAKLPKGVLLSGPPGTGKTLLARALAGEVDGNYFYASGSEFVNKYVGVGADNVRKLFDKAKDSYKKTGKPSIVFIDEIDAVGKQRSATGEGGEGERDQTVNQLLTCIQGFDPNNGTLVIAATNRPETLDSGLTRSGRFDYKIEVGRPDKKGRKAIFKIYLRCHQLEEGVTLDSVSEDLARRSHDFVGADIELAVNMAATLAAKRNAPALSGKSVEEIAKTPRIITRADLHTGIDQVMYGELIKSKVRSEAERRTTAIHEIGHACIPTVLGGDPVTRITVVMTTKSLGHMESIPEEDRYGWTREQFLIRIKSALAGRISEEMHAGSVSTGASSDFEKASQMARGMVGAYGMSPLGLISLPLDQHGFPVGNIGPELQSEFNLAWRKIITDAEAEVRQIVGSNGEKIKRIAEILLEEETLTGQRFRELWAQEEAPAAAAEQVTVEPTAKDDEVQATTGDAAPNVAGVAEATAGDAAASSVDGQNPEPSAETDRKSE